MLGQDVHVHRQHLDGWFLGREYHRVFVWGLDLVDLLDVVDEQALLLVQNPVERVRHVLRRDRLPVLPLRILVEVEGPGEAVLGVFPGVGQARHRARVLRGEVNQQVVGEVHDLERGNLHELERVEAVNVVGIPDTED